MGRRAALFWLVSLLAPATSFGLDFGGFIDNSTGYVTTGTPAFEQSDKLGLWFTTGLGKNLQFNVQASGDYQNQTTYGGASIGPYADLDRLTLAGRFSQVPGGPSLFAFTLGRYLLADPTGDIFDQTLDGAQLVFGYPRLTLSASVGYTGLTIKPSSTIVMSKADSTALGESSQYFGSPRAVGELVLTAPTLFQRQDLTVAALVQQDLRPLFPNSLVTPGTPTYSPNSGGALDTQYFTAGLSGPIASGFYWNGFLTLETGRMLSYITADSQYEYKPILAFLATGGVRYYRPELLNLAVGLDASFASGDADFSTFYEGNTSGDATAFIPITQSTIATVFSPELENILTSSISVSVKPLSAAKNPNISDLQTILAVIPFLRPTDGPISAGGVVAGNGQLYLGTELDETVNYRPFSDLGLAVAAGVFFPNASAFTGSSGSLQYGGKLAVSYSF